MKGIILLSFAFAFAFAAAGAAPFVTQAAPAAQAQTQELAFGVIQGTVVKEGTSDPIPEVHLSVALTPQQARGLVDAAARGAAGIPSEILQAARGTGPRGSATPAPLTAVSDNAGRFTLTVPEGATTVRAECEGYFGPLVNGASPAIVTASTTVSARQPAVVRLAMIPGGTINGRVTDASGKPLTNAGVAVARRAFRHGQPALDLVDGQETDDRGVYRLYRLAPGDYFVVALRGRVPSGPTGAAATPSSKDVAATTFYPSAMDVTTAATVTVHSGDDLAGIDIMVRTATTFTVTGRVSSTLPPGSEVGAINGAVRQPIAQISLLPHDSNVLPNLLAPSTLASADGTFKIADVLPGQYDVIARLPASTGWGPQNGPERATNPWAFGRAVVDVNGSNVDGVAIVVHQGVDVTGRVTVDGNPAPANLRINLQPDDDSATYNNFFETIGNYQPVIDQNGAFTFPLIPEARYRFQFTVGGPATGRGPVPSAAVTPVALGPSAYVADVQQGGISVYDSGLMLGVDAIAPIEVMVRSDGGSIEGAALGPDQKPVADQMVVLVPAAARRQNPALFRVAATDAQGHFNIARVGPGAYKLFAWDSVLPGAYLSAVFLQRYESQGSDVTARAGAKATVDVRVIRSGK
jgi:hypothetical protein